ncbi:MAG: ATP-binding cassette domain-containing protein, partial [Halobacteriota archaeon]
MLEAENLHVSYGDLVALRDVSISIDEGSFTVLLGPNGAGKTTFLNTVSGV